MCINHYSLNTSLVRQYKGDNAVFYVLSLPESIHKSSGLLVGHRQTVKNQIRVSTVCITNVL